MELSKWYANVMFIYVYIDVWISNVVVVFIR